VIPAPLVNGFHTVFRILIQCYVDVVTTKNGTCVMIKLNTVIWRQRRVINQGVPVVVTHGVPYLIVLRLIIIAVSDVDNAIGVNRHIWLVGSLLRTSYPYLLILKRLGLVNGFENTTQ